MAPILKVRELWSEYVKAQQPTHRVLSTEQVDWNQDVGGQSVQRTATVTTYELTKDGQTMTYTFEIIGDGAQPSNGYPLYIGLHGGGGARSVAEFETWSKADQDQRRQSNDNAWHTMSQRWYVKAIRAKGKPAVYIAPRGITNTWDLGFRPETYGMLQKLIMNLLLKQPLGVGTGSAPTFIDGNRVYLLGFSAGGDAVYRHATKISDCFGAVNMSAGHPGDVKFSNLANLPICLQVGENDDDHGYNRMALTAHTSLELVRKADEMKKIEPSKPYYIHDCFVHRGKGHSSWGAAQDFGDNATDVVARDVTLLGQWYGRNKNGVDLNNGADPKRGEPDPYDHGVNTSAITWVNQHSRNPVPAYVVWDLSSRPPRPDPLKNVVSTWEPKRYFYWLMITKEDAGEQFGDNDIIHTSYDKKDNAFWIRKTPVKLTILLNDAMLLKLDQAIKVYHGPAKTALPPIKVTQSVQIQKMTLEARGDPNLIFSAAISFDPLTDKAMDGLFPESTVRAVL